MTSRSIASSLSSGSAGKSSPSTGSRRNILPRVNSNKEVKTAVDEEAYCLASLIAVMSEHELTAEGSSDTSTEEARMPTTLNQHSGKSSKFLQHNPDGSIAVGPTMSSSTGEKKSTSSVGRFRATASKILSRRRGPLPPAVKVSSQAA